MKNLLKKIDWYSFFTIVPFVIVLGNMVSIMEHPILYSLALLLFVAEGLRSYAQGIEAGIKMIQNIRK